MGKNLTWQELRAEMSLAGAPDQIVELAIEFMFRVYEDEGLRNIPSLNGVEYALVKIIEEVRLWRKIEEERRYGPHRQQAQELYWQARAKNGGVDTGR